MKQLWIDETRKNLICVDSYTDGVLKGQLFKDSHGWFPFASLSQFLILMEEMLEESPAPQSYTIPRRFTNILEPSDLSSVPPTSHRGALATFELNILFRQNTSWQGTILWKEAGKEQSFRSMLELILLMDSALRTTSE